MNKVNKASVVVTDPNLRVSRQVARACSEADVLEKYVMGFVYEESGWADRWFSKAPGRFGNRMREMASKRKVQGVPREEIRSLGMIDLTSQGIRSLHRNSTSLVPRRVLSRLDQAFDYLAAQSLSDHTTHVYANEGSARATFRAAKRLGIDTILEGTQHPAVLEQVLASEYDRLGLNYPKVVFRRELVEEELAGADIVFTQSEYAAETFVKSGIAKDKVRVVPLGVDLGMFAPRSLPIEDRDERLRLLFVGQVSVRKGIAYLLEAMERMRDPRVELTVVGAMTSEMVPIWPRLTGNLGGSVVYKGVMSRERLVAEYQAADLLVLPSLFDSFGLVAMEAMACGTPVLVTEACGVPVEDGLNGFVVPVANVSAIGTVLETLVSEPELLERLGIEAALHARDHDWSRFRREVLSGLGIVDVR